MSAKRDPKERWTVHRPVAKWPHDESRPGPGRILVRNMTRGTCASSTPESRWPRVKWKRLDLDILSARSMGSAWRCQKILPKPPNRGCDAGEWRLKGFFQGEWEGDGGGMGLNLSSPSRLLRRHLEHGESSTETTVPGSSQ